MRLAVSLLRRTNQLGVSLGGTRWNYQQSHCDRRPRRLDARSSGRQSRRLRIAPEAEEPSRAGEQERNSGDGEVWRAAPCNQGSDKAADDSEHSHQGYRNDGVVVETDSGTHKSSPQIFALRVECIVPAERTARQARRGRQLSGRARLLLYLEHERMPWTELPRYGKYLLPCTGKQTADASNKHDPKLEMACASVGQRCASHGCSTYPRVCAICSSIALSNVAARGRDMVEQWQLHASRKVARLGRSC